MKTFLQTLQRKVNKISALVEETSLCMLLKTIIQTFLLGQGRNVIPVIKDRGYK